MIIIQIYSGNEDSWHEDSGTWSQAGNAILHWPLCVLVGTGGIQVSSILTSFCPMSFVHFVLCFSIINPAFAFAFLPIKSLDLHRPAKLDSQVDDASRVIFPQSASWLDNFGAAGDWWGYLPIYSALYTYNYVPCQHICFQITWLAFSPAFPSPSISTAI